MGTGDGAEYGSRDEPFKADSTLAPSPPNRLRARRLTGARHRSSSFQNMKQGK
jgi:hypothetical protein